MRRAGGRGALVRAIAEAIERRLLLDGTTPVGDPIAPDTRFPRIALDAVVSPDDSVAGTKFGVEVNIDKAVGGGGGEFVPGEKLAVSVTTTRAATAASSGSGHLVVFATHSSGSPVKLLDVDLKLNGRSAKPVTRSYFVTLPAPIDEGDYTVSGTFTEDAGSAVTGSDVGVETTRTDGSATVLSIVHEFEDKVPLVATDPDGTVAAFTLKGGGSGRIVTNDDGTGDLVLTGTTAKTKVTVVTRQDGPANNDPRFNVRNITADGPVGSVSAPGVDASGNITFGGAIGTGVFGNVRDGHTITLPSSAVPATLSFLSVANAALTSGQPIGSLSVREWLDSDATADLVTAPSILKLAATGDFQASLAVSGNVGTVTVGGTLGGSSMHTLSAANFGKVSVGSVRNTDLFAGVASATQPASASDFASAPSSILAFTMRGTFSATSIAARTIGTVALTSVSESGDAPSGVAALKIKSYSRDKAKKAIPVSPGVVDSASGFLVRVLG